MTFKKFEEIDAWQKARELCKRVHDLTNRGEFAKDWPLKNQMKSASGSVMDCIAEGHGRSQKNEFRYMLGVAKGSCEETRSQAYRAFDCGYLSHEELDDFIKLTNQISASLYALMRHLNQSEHKGIRVKSVPDTISFEHPIEFKFPNQPPP